MSMDAGGLAHMTTYNNHFTSNSGPSYRGKGSHLRNISVPASSNLAAPSAENEPTKTPRSARSALLANLRTAPKTPNPTPTSAPIENGLGASRHAISNNPSRYNGVYEQGNGTYQSPQGLPTPPSSSPAVNYVDHGAEQVEEMDQEMYAQMLMAQNYYLQQAQLQQQIATAQKVQQLQQQLAQLQMQSGAGYSATPPMSPGMGVSNGAVGMYGSGMYNVYNAYQQPYLQTQGLQGQAYGQYSPQQQLQSPPIPSAVEISPPTPQDQVPPPNVLSMAASTRASNRSRSPPKLNLQQSNTSSSSSSSSSSFRRGHRKASSLSTCTTMNNVDIAEAPKTAVPRSMLPSTPLTATFGPGHASGTHPIRQPRGPPAIDELKEKPTSKVEGSKNFATRQRRRAISRLVTAGIERRSARSTSGSVGGTMTPVSENDGFGFEETESVSSSISGMTGRQSRQSLRDLEGSNSSDDGTSSGKESSGLRAPKLVLSAAEKRKSALF